MKDPTRMLDKRVRDQKEALLALRLVGPQDQRPARGRSPRIAAINPEREAASWSVVSF